MESNQVGPIGQPADEPAGGGCLNSLGWYAASFVLPIGSLSFYRRASRRSTGSAVLFFVLFMAMVTLLTTIGVGYQMSKFSGQIRQSFESGKMPAITISRGIASVKGQQPAVLLDQDHTLIVVDTTGYYQAIDRTRYSTGILLTRTELHVLTSQGEYQRIPLAQVQQVFQQDPLVINAETTARYWQNFTAIFSAIALLGLGLWNLLVRFIYLLALAVIVWGIVSLIFPKPPFGFILSLGIYAFVPALYLVYLLNRVGVSFFLLQTLILVAVWGLGIYAAMAKDGWDLLGPDRPLRRWRLLVGLPFLIVLALDVIFKWPNGGWIDLIAGALTGIALVAAGMFSLPRGEDEPAAPPSGDSPGGPDTGSPSN